MTGKDGTSRISFPPFLSLCIGCFVPLNWQLNFSSICLRAQFTTPEKHSHGENVSCELLSLSYRPKPLHFCLLGYQQICKDVSLLRYSYLPLPSHRRQKNELLWEGKKKKRNLTEMCCNNWGLSEPSSIKSKFHCSYWRSLGSLGINAWIEIC